MIGKYVAISPLLRDNKRNPCVCISRKVKNEQAVPLTFIIESAVSLFFKGNEHMQASRFRSAGMLRRVD